MRNAAPRDKARRTPLAMALIAATLSLAADPRPAHAWTDARPAGLVTELAVDRDGGATVTLRIRWRVLAGRFHGFELDELPADAALLEATAADATGVPVPVATRIPAPGRLEVSLGEEGAGLRRGAIDVVVSYTTSLRAQGAIRRHGDDALLDVATVPWERGLEATEVRVALPSSARRAQWLADETPGVDATVTSELGRDVVHAVRRHLPAGTRWTGRVACDPALFAWLDRPDAAPVAVRRIDRHSLGPFAALAAGLALALGGALATLARGRRGRTLISLPTALGSLPWVLASAGGVVQALVVLRTPGAASLGTALALAGFALTVPRLATAEPASSALASHLLTADRARSIVREARPSRRRALGVGAALLAALVMAAFATARHSAPMAVAAIDVALVALAACAVLRPLAPAGDARLLERASRGLARRLARRGEARVAFRARGDGHAPGALVARVVPRPGHRFVRGLRAIELAVAWRPGALAWQGTVMLSVRVERGTALEKPLRRIAARTGSVATSPDGDEIAFVAELVGPDRGALAALERMLPAALVPAPSASASDASLADARAGDEALA